MTLPKSEFANRFTGSEMLRTIPARQAQRDQIAMHTAAFLSRGASITECPPPMRLGIGEKAPKVAPPTELWTVYQASDSESIARSTVHKLIRTGRGPAIASGSGKRGDPFMVCREVFKKWANSYKASIGR